MLSLIKDLYSIFTLKQKTKFVTLQILVIVMAFLEVVGIASIGPFMSLVSDNSYISSNSLLNSIYLYLDFTTEESFLTFIGFIVLLLLITSSVISMITTWILGMFSARVGTQIADRLYAYYMKREWLFHSESNSAELTKQIANEATRVTDLVILPLMMLNAKSILLLFLCLGLLIYQPVLSFFILTSFSSIYFIQYLLVRNILLKNGETLSKVAAERFKLMNEGFGGIRDLILLDRTKYFTDRFSDAGVRFANARGLNHVLWQVPKYFIEMLAFSILIGIIIYFIALRGSELSEILPVISIFALAAFKLLPALQQVYASLGQIKGNISAFLSIKEDLLKSNQKVVIQTENIIEAVGSELRLENVYFNYPSSQNNSLTDLNLSIPQNSSVGIVGPSGSGKSTLIDIISGLIPPSKGRLLFNDQAIDSSNNKQWQKRIGLVSQSIFLTEETIRRNIAFGIEDKLIDDEKIELAIRLASLEDFINSLQEKENTPVGERGVQLSGGQIQRIGIARALYNNAEILIFDEATSSLDGLTEKLIIESINNLRGKKTIIFVAHRLNTVKLCNNIILLKDGSIHQEGTFDDLFENSELFREMVKNS